MVDVPGVLSLRTPLNRDFLRCISRTSQNSLHLTPQHKMESTEKKQPKSFEALTPELSEWILEFTHSMGFARTTPVQAMAIPLLMGNKDLVVEVSNSILFLENRADF